MNGPGRWRSLLSETAALRFDQADLSGSLRCTVGVVVPLVIGLSTGAVADGLAAAIGALSAGMASFQGAYRSRATITLLVAAGMALATVTGAVASKEAWSAVLVVGLWGAAAGMMTSLGQASLVVGLQWCVAVIIVNAFPMTLEQALIRGLMVLAGGALQTVLVVLAWPIRTYASERRAISAAYRDLSGFAARGALSALPEATTSSVPTALSDARAALNDPQPFAHTARLVGFQVLVDEADRLRVSLVALMRLAAALEGSQAADGIHRLLGDASEVLGLVADAVASGREAAAAGAASRLEAATGSRQQMVPVAGGTPTAWMHDDVAQTADALGGQLRSVVRSICYMNSGRRQAIGAIPPGTSVSLRPGRRGASARDTLETLRVNLSWRSGVFRHAVRLAVTLAVALAIYRASGLAHGYWIALTALIVLRPDFNQTLVRGLSRIGGTIVGAGLCTLLVAAVKPDRVVLTVMFAAVVSLAFYFVRVNYAIFSVFVTSYVVFFLAFAAIPAPATAAERVLNTLIGGAMAILAYFAWPTWESGLTGSQLATLVEQQAAYAETLLAVYTDPASPKRRSLGDRRAAARLARSNAEMSVQRMASEPRRSLHNAPVDLDTARGVVAAARRVSAALLTLQSHLPGEDGVPIAPVGEFSRCLVHQMRREAAELAERTPTWRPAGKIRSAMSHLGIVPSMEGGGGPGPPPGSNLRAAHNRLGKALSQGTLPAGERLGAVPVPRLLIETDEIVDAVNSVADLLAG